MTDIAGSVDERGEIRVTRFFAGVQPERGFHAYTTPAELAEFFAPEGLSIDVDSVVIEPHVGGRFECTMVFDDTGEEAASIGVLIEEDVSHLLVGTQPDSVTDCQAQARRAKSGASPQLPYPFLSHWRR